MRSVLILLAIAMAACGDGPPQWPQNTRLVGSDVQGTRVTLEWPAPTDADGVKAYSVRQNGTLLAQIDGTITTYTAEKLEGSTEYTFEVAALDQKGKWSQPLSAKVKTGDAEPPRWPEDASVEATLESKGPLGTAVTFTWSEAQDNVAVTAYRVVRQDDEEVVGELAANAGREVVYQSIDVDGRYEVQARDEAGNWSTTGPVTRVWANKGLRPMLKSQGLLTTPRMQGFEPPALPLMRPPGATP